MSGKVNIYRLYVDASPECYIGQTTMTLLGSQGRLARHRTQSHRDAPKCVSEVLFETYGDDAVKIQHLETVDEGADAYAREAHWIQHFRPHSLNRNLPQPAATSQRTSEGKKAYMAAYREENKEALRKYDAERRAAMTQEDRDKAAAQKRAWIAANKEHVLAQARELLTCEKCGEQYPRKQKWRHDAKHKPEAEAAAAAETAARQALREQCLKMREEGMTLRAIGAALMPPVTHDKVRRLLAEATPPVL